MDWLVWITQLLTLVMVILLWRSIKHIEKRLDYVEAFVNTMRARQSKIKSPRASQRIPEIDARARTTIRDTPDLEPTGRMSTGVHRKKSNAATPEL